MKDLQGSMNKATNEKMVNKNYGKYNFNTNLPLVQKIMLKRIDKFKFNELHKEKEVTPTWEKTSTLRDKIDVNKREKQEFSASTEAFTS